MVLIASSSVFPYGMMGKSVDGEKIEEEKLSQRCWCLGFVVIVGWLAVMPASLITPEWTFLVGGSQRPITSTSRRTFCQP
jgi:membrane protein CcdC involved in cytochrome C biogenesis